MKARTRVRLKLINVAAGVIDFLIFIVTFAKCRVGERDPLLARDLFFACELKVELWHQRHRRFLRRDARADSELPVRMITPRTQRVIPLNRMAVGAARYDCRRRR